MNFVADESVDRQIVEKLGHAVWYITEISPSITDDEVLKLANRQNMKPCNIGIQGTYCKNCGMGPCRLPLPKSGIDGKDDRKGLCGASANTIAERNFIGMIAGGASAHSVHGRCVAEVFISAARKETESYKVKDEQKLLSVAPYFGVATTVDEKGNTLDRDIDEIALEVAERALNEWGKPEGELLYLKRAPEALYNTWKKMVSYRETSTGKSSKSCTGHISAWTRIIKISLISF